MTAIASTDVTITLAPQDADVMTGLKTISFPTIAFGNGTLTYPTGGIPLPAIGKFGMKRQLKMLLLQQPSANGFVYKYDAANHKIKIFTQGMTTGSTAASTSASGALAKNSAGAETAVRLYGTAVNTTYDLGGMIELPATIAPAAVSLTAMAVGE